MQKKLICLILTVFLIGGTVGVYASSFYDVPDDFWAAPYIESLASRNIVSGYGDGYFLPENNVLRCEYAKMLVNAAGIPLSSVRTSPYADVDINSWEFPYINSVSKYMNGYQSSTPGDERIYFKPYDYATREDVTVALMKALGYTYSQLVEKYGDTEYLLSDTFYDYWDIPKQDRPFIAEAVNLGYITGTQEGTFLPADSITRCEVCAILCRAFPDDNSNSGTLSYVEPNDNKDPEMPSELSLGIYDLRVFYLDVGQGDSEFIELPNGKTILIDAATADQGQAVADFIRSRGHSKIDYLIATHPHADHIGGMPDIIENFEIGEICMPEASTNTKTYERLLTAILDNDIPVTKAQAGVELINDDSLCVSLLAPCGAGYDELNNYSAVVKISYGLTSFLFMGDAEAESEDEILSRFSADEIKADVIKIGHHGSSTSSGQSFLSEVAPQYAVISCGANNSYGHPHDETLEKLISLGINIYRTDTDGTISFFSNGTNIVKQ